jgi:hypothetical protein
LAVRVSEQSIPTGLTAADLGETSTTPASGGGDYTLVSYLTSPLRTATKLDYVLFATGGATADEYEWSVTLDPPGWELHRTTSEIGVFYWTPKAPGTYEVSVEVRSGSTADTLTLTQTVQDPTAALETHLTTNRRYSFGWDALRELVNDLKGYMSAAVTATGPDGIPLRLLAAVLYMEIQGRPKEGTAKADAIRKGLGEQTWWNWWPRLSAAIALEEPGARHFDDIRDVEIELVAEFLDELNPAARFFMGNKSLGIGQIGQATATMALGKITWRDQPTTARAATRELVEDDYDALGFQDKVDTFNRLRFPKASVALSAMLLDKLKKRSQRWPSMTAADLAKNQRAMAILATEYNMGPTTTPAASAGESSYGARASVWAQDGSFLSPEVFFQ